MDKVVGKCSICGGDVIMPYLWWGVYPPKPECWDCGAIPAKPELPVIPMKKVNPPKWLNNINKMKYLGDYYKDKYDDDKLERVLSEIDNY